MWLCGSTSCTLMFFYYRYFLTVLEATFPMMLKTGLKPLFVKYVMFSLKVDIADSYFKYLTGLARIAFDDRLYSTNMEVFPSIELIGNFPLKSTYIVLYFGFNATWYASR